MERQHGQGARSPRQNRPRALVARAVGRRSERGVALAAAADGAVGAEVFGWT